VANAPDEMNPEITALSVIYLLIVHNPATGSCPTSGNNFRKQLPECVSGTQQNEFEVVSPVPEP
jgi:hypothetical protein